MNGLSWHTAACKTDIRNSRRHGATCLLPAGKSFQTLDVEKFFDHVEENWSYLDSLYYSFVSFSTVGFGDLVATHRSDYRRHDCLYRAVNWLLTLFGCCCVYSLFNVTSLVIKLFLNFLIGKLNVRCPATAATGTCLHRPSTTRRSSCAACSRDGAGSARSTCLRQRRCCLCSPCCRPRKTTAAAAASQVAAQDGVSFSRRNAIVLPGQRGAKPPPRSTRTVHPLSVADLQRRRQNGGVVTATAAADRCGADDSSPAADSAPSSRRSSNEYVSIRDFLLSVPHTAKTGLIEFRLDVPADTKWIIWETRFPAVFSWLELTKLSAKRLGWKSVYFVSSEREFRPLCSNSVGSISFGFVVGFRFVF